MTTLNVHNQQLTNLDCSGNKLTELDVSKNLELTHLFCSCNELTELDLSKNINLLYLYCRNNPYLKQIFITKGQDIEILKDKNTEIIEVEDDQMTLDELKRSIKLYRAQGLVQAAIDCQEFDHKKEGLLRVLKEIESLLTEYLKKDGSF